MYEDIKKAAETLGFTGTFEIAARRILCVETKLDFFRALRQKNKAKAE